MGRANSVVMSGALEGVQIVPMDASRHPANGDRTGIVVPLRTAQLTTAETERQSSPEGLGPLSPELALVDPELARAARALLPDVPRGRSAGVRPSAALATDQTAFVERLRSNIEPIPEVAPRPSRPLRAVVLGLTLLGLGLLLAVVIESEWWSTPRQGEPALAQSADSPPAPTSVAAAPTTSASPDPEPPSTQAVAPEPTPATPPGAATAPALSTPSNPPAPPPGQTFVWAATAGAAAYEFQLFRGNTRVFRARAVEPRLELPGRWRQGGRTQTLTPGTYRWYVWPISSRTNRPSNVAVVQARLVIGESP
jgi:hypothetical protein